MLLSQVEKSDIARLSALFCDRDEPTVRRELIRLRASRKQRGASVIVDAAKIKVSSREDMAALRARLSLDADIALSLSVLLGNSPREALTLLDDATPFSISQLAIGGSDLIDLGYSGREIGKTLARLLDEVIKAPTLNNRSELLKMASKWKLDE